MDHTSEKTIKVVGDFMRSRVSPGGESERKFII